MLGVDLCIVDHTKLDGVQAQFLGHLVHGHLQCHQAWRLSRCTHGVAFGQVQYCQAHGGHAVVAGVQQLGGLRGLFDLAVGQVARPALVGDGGNFAIGTSANADALDGGRPVGGVVDHLRAGECDFHWPCGHARAEGGQYRVGPDEQLAAKAAANVGRHQAYIFLGNAQGGGHIADAPGDHLIGGPQGQRVALPGRHRGVGFHHRVGLVGGGVGRIELDGCGSEGAVEVATGSVGHVVLGFDRRCPGAGQVELAVGLDVLDLHALCGGAGLFEGVRDHQGDGLVVMLDVRPGQQAGYIVFAQAKLAGIGCGDDSEYARRGLRLIEVYRGDAALGDGRAHHHAVGRVACGLVLFIGVRCAAGGLQRPLDARRGFADDVQLVDRVGCRWCIELHA
ncbi:hypothetical protein D3C80_648860 [compost metagenome]